MKGRLMALRDISLLRGNHVNFGAQQTSTAPHRIYEHAA